jgi:hypothetical protein
MTPGEITTLRRIYGEICRGYSICEYSGKETYVAHLTTFDQTDIDIIQDEAMREANSKGIKTEAEKLKWLETKKIWTKKDESELAGQRAYVEGLEKTRSRLALKAQIAQVDKQLLEGRQAVNKLAERRYKAIGLTAERVAEQRVQLEYIRASFCKDADLREPLLSAADIRELSEEDSDILLITYVDVVSRFSVDNIKKIAVQPFFINQFYLCGEYLRDFFGVPIVDLTIYQANLLSYGQYYRNIFTHHQVPKDISTDPEKIEDFVTRGANAKKLANQTAVKEGGRVGIVGATAEDFQAMGVEDGTSQMRDAAKKQYRDGKEAARDMGYTIVNK